MGDHELFNNSPNQAKEKVLFVDGGMQHARLFDLNAMNESTKDFDYSWIGDGDGHVGDIPISSKDTHQLPTEKDQSDLAMAFNLYKGESIEQIFLHGLIGGRLDHQLAVIGELFKWYEILKPLKMVLFDENSKVKMELFSGEYLTKHFGTLSLFTLEKQLVSLRGALKYQGEKLIFHPFQSHGLSNEAQGEFSVVTEKPVILIRE